LLYRFLRPRFRRTTPDVAVRRIPQPFVESLSRIP
jgi:hypothetical protein